MLGTFTPKISTQCTNNKNSDTICLHIVQSWIHMLGGKNTILNLKARFCYLPLHTTPSEQGHTNFRHLRAPSTNPCHHSQVKRGISRRVRKPHLATEQLNFKMLLESSAQPVKSKGVYTRIAESQNPRHNGNNKMNGRGAHIGLISEWAVQLQLVIRQPAESKKSQQHQHHFHNSLPEFNL